MPGRKYQATSSSSYRYGFNGQEKSDDVIVGNTTAEYWEYDSRIGRRWNVDPKLKTEESSYLTFSGNPIFNMDLKGDKASSPLNEYDKNGKKISDLGGSKIDFRHQENGSVKITDVATGEKLNGKISSEYTGEAKTFMSTVRIKQNGKPVVTKVEATKVDNGDLNFYFDNDNGERTPLLFAKATCGDGGGLGSLPNGSFTLKANSPYNKLRSEGQFQTSDWDKSKDNFGPGFGFTFEIAVTGMTRGNFRLHPRGVSHGCIALICNVSQAKILRQQVSTMLKANGDIKLDVNLKNNEKAIKDQPKDYIDE